MSDPNLPKYVEPDSPPMRSLTSTIVVLSVVVIASSIGLFYFMQFAARAEYDKKLAPNPELTAQREKDQRRLAGWAFEAERNAWNIPVAKAMELIAADPTLLKHGPPPPTPAPGQAPPPPVPPGGAAQ